jgi:hypothetical protein
MAEPHENIWIDSEHYAQLEGARWHVYDSARRGLFAIDSKDLPSYKGDILAPIFRHCLGVYAVGVRDGKREGELSAKKRMCEAIGAALAAGAQ